MELIICGAKRTTISYWIECALCIIFCVTSTKECSDMSTPSTGNEYSILQEFQKIDDAVLPADYKGRKGIPQYTQKCIVIDCPVGRENLTAICPSITKEEEWILESYGNFTVRKTMIALEYPVRHDAMFHLNDSGITTLRRSKFSSRDGIMLILKQRDFQKFNTSVTVVVGLITFPHALTRPNVETGGLVKHENYILTNLGLIFVSLRSTGTNSLFTQPIKVTYRYDFSPDDTILQFKSKKSMVEKITRTCNRLDAGKWTNDCISHTSVAIQTCECNVHGNMIFGMNETVKLFTSNLAIDILYIVFVILLSLGDLLLLITIALLLRFRKKLKSHRVLMQLGIATAFLGEGLIPLMDGLAHRVKLSAPELCEIVAVLSLYFDITAVFWMLNEGVILFVKIGLAVYVNHEKVVATRRMVALSICTWLLPALVVGIWAPFEILTGNFVETDTLYADMETKNSQLAQIHNASLHPLHKYSQYRYCWVSHESRMKYLILITVVAALSINVIIAAYVLRVMWRMAAKEQQRRDERNRQSSTVLAKAVLILTWSLGAPNLVTLLLMQYSTVKIVGLLPRVGLIITQGPLVFYFYCVKNTDLRESIKIWKERRKLHVSAGT